MPLLRDLGGRIRTAVGWLGQLGPVRLTIVVAVFLVILIGCRQAQQAVTGPGAPAPAAGANISPPAGAALSGEVPWKTLAGLERPKSISGPQASAVHPAQFILAHAKVAREDKKSCAQCHRPEYCNGCHKAYTTHPLNWLLKHGKASEKGTLHCEQCHPRKACQRCHTEGRPPTHDGNWLKRHGLAAELETACQECHTRKGCQTCHQKARPEDHKLRNWQGIHGAEAKQLPGRCYACHGREGCTSCHGGTLMPHEEEWLQVHGDDAGARRGRGCQQCHERNYCSDCHQRSMPRTHTATWTQKHGAASRKADARCSMCHKPGSCVACHGMPMPHPAKWEKSAHARAAEDGADSCAKCHPAGDCLSCHAKRAPASHREKGFRKQHNTVRYDRRLCDLCHGQKSCTACHQGLTMPHPEAFKAGEHGPLATRKPQLCAQCHRDSKDCMACHDGLAPGGHQAKGFRAQHGEKANQAYCTLCHGANSCTTCHSQIKKSPHGDDWALTHKQVASFNRGAKCFLCHKIDYCAACHEGAKFK